MTGNAGKASVWQYVKSLFVQNSFAFDENSVNSQNIMGHYLGAF